MAGTPQQSRQLNDPRAVIIPVKTFDRAKARLADALSSVDRSLLARVSASRVVVAAAPLDTFVVCDDDTVKRWAIDHGANVMTPPQPGLNQAVSFGCSELRRRGYRTAIIAHGDLPLARELAWVGDFPGISIVTDRHGDGTNVMAVPTDIDFNFAYGPGSGHKHRMEALRQGLSVRWIRDKALSHDIDTPADLHLLTPEVRDELLGQAVQTSSPTDEGAAT